MSGSRPLSTTELYGPPKVGRDALAYCTRCKIDLAHVIVSMLGGRPAKVICKTCKSQHNYKLGGPGRASAAGITARSTKKETIEVRASEYWEQQMKASKGELKPYAFTTTFKKGDIVQHSIFGDGIVEEVRTDGKILVLFRVGDKVLVHGKK